MPKSVLRAVVGRMQFTLHATRRTPHGPSRLVQAMSAWLMKTRRAPSRHSRDARVYGHTTTAMHELSTPPTHTAQLSSAHSYIPLTAAQRRAVPCGVVSCCAVLSFEHTAVPGICCEVTGTRYRYVRVFVLIFYLTLFKVDCPLSAPMLFSPRKLHPHCQSECDIANKHTVQCTA